MGSSKKSKKAKKESKRSHRHRDDVGYLTDSSAESRLGRRKHKKSKKAKFRKPKRRKRSTSSEASSNYGEMNDVLKTPPKHQKAKRILYRRKLRNIDPDMFVPLKKFAYDKEKMVQQAFLTLRRGVIERICPPELDHLSLDELKERLVQLATTMSKERLRTYADDDDMSHASDSYEPDTPTDDSESELEVVEDEELVEQFFAEQNLPIEKENELRERLARKKAEKALQERLQKEKTAAELEEGEIKSDEDNTSKELKLITDTVSLVPLPPTSPTTEYNIASILLCPPPPPPPIVPNQPLVSALKKKTPETGQEETSDQQPRNVLPLTSSMSCTVPEDRVTNPLVEIDVDLGEDPEIDLY